MQGTHFILFLFCVSGSRLVGACSGENPCCSEEELDD